MSVMSHNTDWLYVFCVGQSEIRDDKYRQTDSNNRPNYTKYFSLNKCNIGK